jgi:hypothetical protein
VADQSTRVTGLFSVIESVGKALILAGALFYVAGLIVVNRYLSVFGFSDFALLRTRFIFTGAIALIPLIVTVYTIFVIVFVVLRDRQLISWIKSRLRHRAPNSMRRTIVLVLSVITGSVALLFAVFAIAQLDADVPLEGYFLLVSCSVLMAVNFYFVINTIQQLQINKGDFAIGSSSVSRDIQRLEEHEGYRHWYSTAVTTNAILGIPFMFLYLITFSIYFYPRISEQFGGGEPKTVQLVLLDDFVDEGVQAGLVLEENSQRSVPLPLLWEGEGFYLVFFPGSSRPGWAAQIDKTMVAAVLTYTEPRKGSAFQLPDWEMNSLPFATPGMGISSENDAPAATPIQSYPKDP